MKKLPYGISDFRRLWQDNCLYVDKTRYIEILEGYDAPYIFFLRPRRFGKTLFLSTLEQYYDKLAESDFEMLFGDSYIGKDPTPLKQSYYMLNFNFSGINTATKESTLQGFIKKVRKGVELFEERYQLDLEYDKTGYPSEIFDSFLTKLRSVLDGKIYVLIDEYDHFANELLSFQVDTFEEVVSQTGFVRKWYEVLKEGTESVVDRIFATGVSPITLDSLTSGFNIAMNLTRDRNLNTMLGFREDEVRFLIRHTLPSLLQDDIETILPDLIKYYNGYLFNEDAQEKVFNSDMALYYLTAYHTYHEPPKDLVDINISSDYGKLRRLFTLKNKERNYGILQELLNGETPKALITREFSLEKRFTRQDFLSLLFYLGFLTIKQAGRGPRVILEVPNYVIKELYFEFFEELLSQNVELETDDIIEGIEALAFEGKIERFISSIEVMLEKVSFRDFIRFDEKYVKLVMLTYLMLSKIYYVKSEYEVENGYLDILLLQRSGIPVDYEAILEVKYLKKKDYEDTTSGQKKLQEKIQAARTQIKQYQQVEELREKPNLKKWITVFSGNTCIYSEEIDLFPGSFQE